MASHISEQAELDSAVARSRRNLRTVLFLAAVAATIYLSFIVMHLRGH